MLGESLLEKAEKYLACGFSVIPVIRESKSPIGPWKQYQSSAMTVTHARMVFSGLNGEHAIGLVCGNVSGGLQAMDFDNKCGNSAEMFAEFINIPEVDQIIRRHNLPYESTPSGGRHLWFRSAAAEPSQKLARQKTITDGVQKTWTVIETRGEGAYCICAPAQNYHLLHGDLFNVQTISVEERNILLSHARYFNDFSLMPVVAFDPPACAGNSRPGDIFNSDPDSWMECLDLLTKRGWRECGRRAGNRLFRRPGKTAGISATFNGTVFYNFSTNAAPFEAGKGYDPFSVFALLKHNGDYHAAAKELAQRQQRQPETVLKMEDRQEAFIIPVLDEKSGTNSYQIKYERYRLFLKSAGFRRLGSKEPLRLLRVEHNIIREVALSDVVAHTLSTLPDPELRDCLIKNERKLFTDSKMRILEPLEDDLNSDTSRTAWMYYRNGALRLTRDSATYEWFEYNELPRPVWENRIIDRDFDLECADSSGSEMKQLCRNVTGNDEVRLAVLMSTIGYLFHRHRQMSIAKAIIFMDEAVAENDCDAHGGTGKSLLTRWVSSYLRAVPLSNKTADMQDRFLFQNVDQDTDLIVADDVTKDFSFQQLFEAITGNIAVEKKHQPPFVLPFERRPNILITTNHTIKGTGNSYARRKQEVLFAAYYNNGHTPRDDFGHDLLTEWSPEQQKREDAFAQECLQFYLDHSLLSNASGENLAGVRQFISETKSDFVDFIIEEVEAGRVRSGIRFNRKDLFESYCRGFDEIGAVRLEAFTKWFSKLSIFGLKVHHRRSHNVLYTQIDGDLDGAIRQLRKNRMKSLTDETLR